MRTIRLTEHAPQQLSLTPGEARELDALPRRLLGVAHQRDGSTRLTPGSCAGTIVLPSVRLLIKPKSGLRNLLLMLGYATRVEWRAEDFPYETDDLMQAIAWWFDREAARATRFGLHCDYGEREEWSATVRGRPVIERQIARHPGQRTPIACRFQEYGQDTILNRVVKAAHLALLRMPDLDRALSLPLRHRARQVFGNVPSVEYSPAAVPDLSLTRLHGQWRSAFRLARLILCQHALRDELGDVHGSAFIVDMNQLFQRFVEEIVRERAAGDDCILEPCVERPLTHAVERLDGSVAPSMHIRPDLVLRRAGLPAAVGDAKYKERVPIDDYYQLVAYCVRLKLDRGLLIHCGRGALTERRIVGVPLTLAAIGIDLSGSPDSVLQQARAAADALTAQAAERAQLAA